MTDKEIYQLIEEHKADADALYEKIHVQVESSIVQHAQAKKKRKKLFNTYFPVAMAFVLIICLAVVLPITLQSPGEDVEIRYNDFDLLVAEKLDFNLEQYYISINNHALLYLDMYEYAEDVFTRRYYEEGHESQTVALQESFTDDMGYKFQLTIIKRNVAVDSIDNMVERYDTNEEANNPYMYKINKTKTIAKFEFGDYKYYLEINDEVELDFLTDIIDNHFKTIDQQATA